jgi:hypothetical protein
VPWPPRFRERSPRPTLRSLPVLALLLFWAAAFAGGRVTEEGRFRVRHVTDTHILVDNVTLSESHISPADSCDISGDRVQDETEIRFRVIWPESIDAAVYVDSADGTIIGVVQSRRGRAPGQTYVTSFAGCPFGPVGRALPDGFYTIVVRAFDDTGRVEDTFLPLEIDRKPPMISRLVETTGAPYFRNGDTVVFELTADRPGYRFNESNMFRFLDSDTDPDLTTITDHGDGSYTIRHEISEANTLTDRADVLIPIDVTDESGNVRKDRSQRVCLQNHPPRLVSSRSLTTTNVFRNGDTIRIETAWDSPNGPLTVSADFGNIDDHYDPSKVVVTERAGNVFELAYPISTLNTKPAYNDYRLKVTVRDQACGVAIDTTIVLGLDNEPPPKPTHDPQPATNRADHVDVTGTAPGADLVEIRAPNNFLNIGPPAADGRFSVRVPLVRGSNTIVIEALDAIGNRSLPDTLRITRDAPAIPVLNPAPPPTTREGSIVLSGMAVGATRVEVRRGSTFIDSVHVSETGTFSINVPLIEGRNNLTLESVNNVDIHSQTLSVSILRLSGTYVAVPARFIAGTGSTASRIDVGLTRAGRNVRVELWSLAGDLLQVIEDPASRELYSLSWDGRDGQGRPVSGGPILSKIQIDFVDGGSETVSRAFVLVKP